MFLSATPAMKRYVFTFTIRDEHGDSIHASCWGTLDYVSPLYAVCSLGAHGIVNMCNCKVNVRH